MPPVWDSGVCSWQLNALCHNCSLLKHSLPKMKCGERFSFTIMNCIYKLSLGVDISTVKLNLALTSYGLHTEEIYVVVYGRADIALTPVLTLLVR